MNEPVSVPITPVGPCTRTEALMPWKIWGSILTTTSPRLSTTGFRREGTTMSVALWGALHLNTALTTAVNNMHRYIVILS